MVHRALAAITASISLVVLCSSQIRGIHEHLEQNVEYADEAERAGLRFQFHNSPTSRKYLIEAMGGGVAILDYDHDGWQDIFLVNGAALKDPQRDEEPVDKSAPEFWNLLFRNNPRWHIFRH
jgi:hypothetical protein